MNGGSESKTIQVYLLEWLITSPLAHHRDSSRFSLMHGLGKPGYRQGSICQLSPRRSCSLLIGTKSQNCPLKMGELRPASFWSLTGNIGELIYLVVKSYPSLDGRSPTNPTSSVASIRCQSQWWAGEGVSQVWRSGYITYSWVPDSLHNFFKKKSYKPSQTLRLHFQRRILTERAK